MQREILPKGDGPPAQTQGSQEGAHTNFYRPEVAIPPGGQDVGSLQRQAAEHLKAQQGLAEQLEALRRRAQLREAEQLEAQRQIDQLYQRQQYIDQRDLAQRLATLQREALQREALQREALQFEAELLDVQQGLAEQLEALRHQTLQGVPRLFNPENRTGTQHPDLPSPEANQTGHQEAKLSEQEAETIIEEWLNEPK